MACVAAVIALIRTPRPWVDIYHPTDPTNHPTTHPNNPTNHPTGPTYHPTDPTHHTDPTYHPTDPSRWVGSVRWVVGLVGW